MAHPHRIEITHMETYIDGSGLVAIISVDGIIFSGQYLGAVPHQLLTTSTRQRPEYVPL